MSSSSIEVGSLGVDNLWHAVRMFDNVLRTSRFRRSSDNVSPLAEWLSSLSVYITNTGAFCTTTQLSVSSAISTRAELLDLDAEMLVEEGDDFQR